MREMDEASVDAIVTDPPYGIGFMGKEWDAPTITRAAAEDAATRKSLGPESASRPGRAQSRSSSAFGSPAHYAGPVRAGAEWQAWCLVWATEALRVLKPGGHLLAFGGTRTYHRLACAVEDAGFEIRDSLIWLYGSGFPKSLDVSKAIDKAAGAERTEVVGVRPGHEGFEGRDNMKALREGTLSAAGGYERPWMHDPDQVEAQHWQTAPATPEAEKWNGWGTALKPGHEPVVMARKPLIGTVAENVQAHGTGALNIDGCRIGADGGTRKGTHPNEPSVSAYGDGLNGACEIESIDAGRWPANVVLDEQAAAELDRQSGERPAGVAVRHRSGGNTFGGENEKPPMDDMGYGDTGGASRFYYCAKASRGERNAGLTAFPDQAGPSEDYGTKKQHPMKPEGEPNLVLPVKNAHPTVKPIALMRWLVRLVTPPDGTVLDPFTGSGTTGCAAVLEDFNFIGIEREAEYAEIARARINYWASQPKQLGLLEAA
jgi:DNA modification methylase